MEPDLSRTMTRSTGEEHPPWLTLAYTHDVLDGPATQLLHA